MPCITDASFFMCYSNRKQELLGGCLLLVMHLNNGDHSSKPDPSPFSSLVLFWMCILVHDLLSMGQSLSEYVLWSLITDLVGSDMKVKIVSSRFTDRLAHHSGGCAICTLQSILNEALKKMRVTSGMMQSLELRLNTDMTFLCLIRERKSRVSLVLRICRWRQSSKLQEVRISTSLEVYVMGSDGKQLHQFPLIPQPLSLEPWLRLLPSTTPPVTGH